MTSNPNHPRYIILEKRVGETPLECAEAWRKTKPELATVSLAYAGRLDPMASGKLLILIGDECKVQEQYHNLDKEYVFEVLFGAGSDSGDVLGIVTEAAELPHTTDTLLTPILEDLTGPITLQYPIFSSRTVHGKPLHTWTVEGRLDEIEIPKKTSTIYSLALTSTTMCARTQVHHDALKKIDSLPTVTDPRKALGNDFRRPDVKASWATFLENRSPDDTFIIAKITCVASSGTYMRSLAEEIGRRLGTKALAYSIHRTKIGSFNEKDRAWDHLF